MAAWLIYVAAAVLVALTAAATVILLRSAGRRAPVPAPPVAPVAGQAHPAPPATVSVSIQPPPNWVPVPLNHSFSGARPPEVQILARDGDGWRSLGWWQESHPDVQQALDTPGYAVKRARSIDEGVQ
jgi:hypothetical protein